MKNGQPIGKLNKYSLLNLLDNREIYVIIKKSTNLKGEYMEDQKVIYTIKEKDELKWTLDLDIFSKFWGLYIMKLPIPQDIWNYVVENKHNMPTKELHLATTMLNGSSNQMDNTLRQLIFMEIQ